MIVLRHAAAVFHSQVTSVVFGQITGSEFLAGFHTGRY